VNRKLRALSISTACLLVLAAASTAVAAEPSAVRISITVERTDDVTGAQAQTYELMAPPKGHAAITLGNRVPIAVENAPPTGGATDPTPTKVSYQDVGFSARIETRPEEDDRVRVSGRIEVSELASPNADTPDPNPFPIVAALTQNFDVIVSDGTTIRLLGVDDSTSTDISIFLRVSFVQ